MRNLFLGTLFGLSLTIGLFSLFSTPAKADILCAVRCVDKADRALLECLASCGIGTPLSYYCRMDCRRVHDSYLADCIYNCGF